MLSLILGLSPVTTGSKLNDSVVFHIAPPEGEFSAQCSTTKERSTTKLVRV